MQGDSERLEQRGLRVGQAVGQRVGEVLGPRHERAQGAVGDAVPREAAVRAEVVQTTETLRATAARIGGVDGNSLALAGTRLDRRNELVSEHERPRQPRVADRRLLEPVPVRAAEPDRSHPEEDVAGKRFGLGLVVQPEVTGTVESQRLHGWP